VAAGWGAAASGGGGDGCHMWISSVRQFARFFYREKSGNDVGEFFLFFIKKNKFRKSNDFASTVWFFFGSVDRVVCLQ
jgi:hypothetical protein